MENRVIDDVHIREYLLGRLDGDPELVERIDEQILTDSQFSISVDVVEDEIIEEYIEGTLNADDARAVERHFLRPPERQLKLRSARLFSRYLATASEPLEAVEQYESPSRAAWIRMWKLPHFRTYAELAAAVVFIVAIALLVYQRRELGKAVEQASQQLAEEHQKEIALNQQVHPRLQIMAPPAVELHLFEAGLTRGNTQLPTVNIGNTSGMLHIEVAIPSDSSGKHSPPTGRYQVQLNYLGQTMWSRDDVDSVSVSGGAVLSLNLPVETLPTGICELVVKQPGKTVLSYSFIVSAKP